MEPTSTPATPTRPRSVLRTWLWTLGILAAVALLIVWLGMSAAKRTSDAAANSPAGRKRGGELPVAAQTVARDSVRIYLNALGTVTPLATATVHSQISGQLMEIRFKEGEIVKAGAPLALIDPRPYQAQLTQYEGALLRDRAQLENARLDLERYKTLLAQDSTSQQVYDTQAALVKQYEGAVKTDEGQLAAARLDLAYCNVVAPIGGRLGLRQVDVGNYVSPGDTNGLVVVTQQSPISVVFALPEDNIPALAKAMAGSASLPVQAFDRAQATQLADGTVTVLDNQIDTSTGTVKLRAQFANADGALFPNQFVNVRVLVQTRDQVLVVPRSAIGRGPQNSNFVYVINADNSVTMKTVTLGPVDGERVVIESGLAGGEQIVTDGADQLKDGQAVSIAGAPKAAADPAAAAGKTDADKPRKHHKRRDSDS